MARPQLVRPALTEDDLISEIRTGNFKAADLERRSGKTRAIIRRLIKEYAPATRIRLPGRRGPRVVAEMSPAIPAPATAAVKPKPTPSRAPILQTLIGIGCALIALAFGAAGMVMNYRFASNFGQDDTSRLVLGGLGLAIDGAALLLLPAAGALGEQRRYGQCLMACVIWIPFVALSTVAAMGFASSNIGDGLQARDTVREHREDMTVQKKRAEAKRNSIKETGDQKILENQMNIALGSVPRRNRDSSKECTEPTLSAIYCYDYNRFHDAYVAAKARDNLDKEIADLTTRIAALPPVSSKDPASDQIAQMTFGFVAADQVGNYRVRGLAVVPGFASILLAFARTLCRRS